MDSGYITSYEQFDGSWIDFFIAVGLKQISIQFFTGANEKCKIQNNRSQALWSVKKSRYSERLTCQHFSLLTSFEILSSVW